MREIAFVVIEKDS